MTTCPNKFPTQSAPYRIAIIGEAPGADEIREGEPFVGMSGRFLRSLLGRNGIAPEAVYFGNVSQYRPLNNDIETFSFDGVEIQSGLCQLALDLRVYKPHLVLLLGNVALKAARDWTPHRLGPGQYTYSVHSWRGSVFKCDLLDSPFFGYKCLSTFHPAYALRDYSVVYLLECDLRRARAQGVSSAYNPPQDELIIPSSCQQACDLLDDYRLSRKKTALDIEGWVLEANTQGMTCISFAQSKSSGFVIPFLKNYQGDSWWTVDEEVEIWRHLIALLEDPLVPKVLQNCLYDMFVLAWSYGILVRGVVDDTMVKHWEMFCELEKGLDTQASIYTLRPFWKHERKGTSWTEHLEYCIKDSIATWEINEVLEPHVVGLSRDHYLLNMQLLEVFLYMELHGIEYDKPLAERKRGECLTMMYGLKYQLDQIAGIVTPLILDTAKAHMCYKKAQSIIKTWADGRGWLKKGFEQDWNRVEQIVESTNTGPHVLGELHELLGIDLNHRTAKYKTFLYDTLKLPPQYKDKTGAITVEYEALLTLYRQTKHPAVDLGMQIAELQTRADHLRIGVDFDQRVRAGYNVCGTTTGRPTCYKSPTQSGYNLATITKGNPLRLKGHPLREGMRDLFKARDGYWLAECDLEGADAWTIAANCSMLGDPTMMNDLHFGLKPAKIMVLLMWHGIEVNNKTRPELYELCKTVPKDSWEYMFSKEGVYGSSYLMGVDLLRRRMLLNSEGKIDLTRNQIYAFQNLFFFRYQGVKKWHDFRRRQAQTNPTLRSASGHQRRFFGRRAEILPEILAHEPQNNTNYVTHLASLACWTDPENHRTDGSVIIEPLHQVYDAFICQFPKDVTPWAVAKIRSYFNNPITIAGQPVLISFEGGYGPSWGDTSVGKI